VGSGDYKLFLRHDLFELIKDEIESTNKKGQQKTKPDAVAFAAPSKASAIEFKKDGFSISLPNGWVEVPRDIMDANEKALSKAAPSLRVQRIDYGFQLDSSKKWFQYPYISVKINRTGRMTENELEKLEGYSTQESYDRYKKDLSSMMTSIQPGKMIFDRKHKIIWMRLDADVANIGPVSGISGMVLTEAGFIQVTGFSLRKDYPIYEPVFQSVALSVYKSKWSDSLPPAITGVDWGKAASKALGKAIAGTIIIAIIALIVFLRRKKNR
jgi:hypothetical protein